MGERGGRCRTSHAETVRVVVLGLGYGVILAACGGDATAPPSGDDPEPLVLEWPVPGVEGGDWTINNYVDLDPGPGLRDYRDGAKVYDGHRGVDIDVPNFRWMDDDHPVLAAHAGQVVAVLDGHPDRHTSCEGTWNVVRIWHPDGSFMIYGHLKRGSITVSVGQQVLAGDQLGVVGSSGCSTAPHLHLELLDPAGRVIDPFLSDLFRNPPEYDPPLRFMDLSLKEGSFTGVDDVKDPPPNLSLIQTGSSMGIGLSMSGGGAGDRMRVTVEDAGGTVVLEVSRTLSSVYRHSYWYWNRPVPESVGPVTLRVFVNDVERATHPFVIQ